jgi:organic hydroperoxide reductase OsmC/OhrA
MLSFLYVAAKRGFVADSYRDEAVRRDGQERPGPHLITDVTLRPDVAFSGSKLPSRGDLDAMHHEAHEMCFIANSVKTECGVEPVVRAEAG